MKRYYIIDGCHAIDLNEIVWFEFCDNGPVTNTGKYRVKMMIRHIIKYRRLTGVGKYEKS